MANMTAVVEERGQDWDVRHEYEIDGLIEDIAGKCFRARDMRLSGLPTMLKSIILPGAHEQEIISRYTLLRDASLRSPYIGDIYRLIFHRRAEGNQLIIATEPPQHGTLATLLKQWTSNPADAPPAMDDAHIIHTGLAILEAIIHCEKAGFAYRDIHPEAIGVGNGQPSAFVAPQLLAFGIPYTGSPKSTRPAFLPSMARGRELNELTAEELVEVDLYALGATLFKLRTWDLWKGAESSEGLSDPAILELNKFRVGEPLRNLLAKLMGIQNSPAEFKSFEDAFEAFESAYWKVAAIKGGAGLPASPLQSINVNDSSGAESMVILEDRELWNHAPDAKQDSVILHVEKELGDDFRWLRTERAEAGGEAHRIGIFEHVKTGIELNLCPGGLFERGTASGLKEYEWAKKIAPQISKDWFQQETPRETVIIPPMLVGRTPVLIGQWERFSKDKAKDDSPVPVVDLSYADISKKLGDAPGNLRLPSEAEWEYACRAGTTSRFFWGEEMDDKFCWHVGNSKGEPMDVTAHKAKTNAFGLVDMLGNVLEWCADHYVQRYTEARKDSQPLTLRDVEADHDRVIRGGCVWYGPAYCRCAARASCRSPEGKKKDAMIPATFAILGFRVFRSLS